MREYERKNVWDVFSCAVVASCVKMCEYESSVLLYDERTSLLSILCVWEFEHKGVRCVLLPSASSFHWGWRKLVPCVVSNQLKRLSWESTEDQRKKWMKWLTRSEMSRIFSKDEKHIFFQQLNFNNSCLLQVFFSTQWRPLFTGTITAHFPPGTITCKINEDWIFRNLKN